MSITIEKVEGGPGWATLVQVEAEKIRVHLRENTVKIAKEPTAAERRWRQQNPSGY